MVYYLTFGIVKIVSVGVILSSQEKKIKKKLIGFNDKRQKSITSVNNEKLSMTQKYI